MKKQKVMRKKQKNLHTNDKLKLKEKEKTTENK